MGTTALKLVTGVLDGKSIRNSITQASHGFDSGMVLRWQTDLDMGSGSVGGFTAAIATSAIDAEVSGIVERVIDDNSFILVYQGEINLENFTTLGAGGAGGDSTQPVYFLSTITGGFLDSNPPSAGGNVIKPVLSRRGTLLDSDAQRGLVMNYIGTIIGGEATVSLDGLMPVGSIQAYAGISSDVPTGWSVCDGGTLDAFKYSEYAARVGSRYGSLQKLTLNDLDIAAADVVGKLIKEERDANNEIITLPAQGNVLSWDNANKSMIVDNITHNTNGDPHTGDGTTSRAATFTTSHTVVMTGVPGVDSPGISDARFYALKKPDLRARIPIGSGINGDITTHLRRGEFGGVANTRLEEGNIPAHNHGIEIAQLEVTVPGHEHQISVVGNLTTLDGGPADASFPQDIVFASDTGTLNLGGPQGFTEEPFFNATGNDPTSSFTINTIPGPEGLLNNSGTSLANGLGIVLSNGAGEFVTGIETNTSAGGRHTHGGRYSAKDEDGGNIEGWANDSNLQGTGLISNNISYIVPTAELDIAGMGDQGENPGTVWYPGLAEVTQPAIDPANTVEVNKNYPIFPSPTHHHTITPQFNTSSIVSILSLNESFHRHTINMTNQMQFMWLALDNKPVSLPDATVELNLGGEAGQHFHAISGSDIEGALTVAPNEDQTIAYDLEAGAASPIQLQLQVSDFGQDNVDSLNNLPPYLVTNYIVRISSAAKAALLDGVNISLSLEGLNNVNDGSPTNNEIPRYSSGASEYQKVHPTIDGFGTKDNQDVVIHTSQDTNGTTLEAIRFGKDGRGWFGFTSGGTNDHGDYSSNTRFVIKGNTRSDNSSNYLLIQGVTHQGGSGAYFGYDDNHVKLWAFGLGAAAGVNVTAGSASSRSFDFWVGGNAGVDNSGDDPADAAETSRKLTRINDTHFIIGSKDSSTAGASLDVSNGGIVAAGDVFTEGGTHGMYSTILGVSAASGGYNFPIGQDKSGGLASAGMSGGVLMICATADPSDATNRSADLLGVTLEFKILDTTKHWTTGAVGKGVSFAANVGIGTTAGSGFQGGVYGATLEVAGTAIIRNGATVGGPLRVGGTAAHVATDNLSVRGDLGQIVRVKSTTRDAIVRIDSGTGYDAALQLYENGTAKIKCDWDGGEDRYSIQGHNGSAWFTALQINASTTQMAIGRNVAINSNFALTVATGGGNNVAAGQWNTRGIGISASQNLLYSGTADVSEHQSSILQLYRENQSFLQFGTTTDAAEQDGIGSNFSQTAGLFIGITSSNIAQIKHIGAGGGTIDFIVGTSGGNTCAAVIHNTGVIQIGATAGGGFANRGFRGCGGLAVTDLDGSTGNSGDILINDNATGQLKWSRDIFIPRKSGETNNRSVARGTHGVGPFDGPYVLVPANFSGAEDVDFDNSITPFFNGKEASGDVTLRYQYVSNDEVLNVTVLNDSGHDIVVAGQLGGGGSQQSAGEKQGLNPAFDYESIATGANLTRSLDARQLGNGVEPWGMILFWRKVT